jgi:hypothetical protein
MASEVSALMSGVSFWESWGYVALAAVFIGVVGETIEEFTNWPKRIGYEKAITRISALILIAGLAGEGITQSNSNATNATLVALLNNQTGQLSLDLEKERTRNAARTWTKTQFDAIQAIKGIVPSVGILWPEHCIECFQLASYIEIALHSADVQIYGAHGIPDDVSTGVFVRLPIGADLNNDPLIVALRKADLNPLSTHHIPEFSKIRTDIPVIFIGEKFPAILTMPYQPPGPTGWTMLPIEKQ